ncbi:MAG: glycosyltransferase family 39 protein [Candidatus Omnitrophota bacterium]
MPIVRSKISFGQHSSLIAVGIFLFSLILRLRLMGVGAFHCDCLMLVEAAEKTVNTGILHYSHSHGFPLTSILAAGFVALAQKMKWESILAVNFMSVVFSSLTVWVFFHFVRKMLTEGTAVISSFLLSVSPIYLGNSLYGNSHMPAAFFILLSLYWVLKFSSDDKDSSLLWSSLFFGLAMAARVQDAVAVYPAFLTLLIFKKGEAPGEKIFRAPWLIFTLLGGSICLIFYAPILIRSVVPGAPSVVYFLNKELFSFLTFGHYLHYFRSYLDLLRQNTLYLGLALFMVSLIVIPSVKKRIFIGVWFFSVLLSFALVAFGLPRFLIMSLPPLYIGIGFVLDWLNHQSRKEFAVLSLLLVLILSIVPFKTYVSIFEERHLSDVTGRFAGWIKDNVEPDSVVIVGDGSVFYLRAGVKLLSRPLANPYFKKNELKTFKEELDNLLAKKVPVYITCHGLKSYDPFSIFFKGMRDYYGLELKGQQMFQYWHRGVLKDSVVPCELYLVHSQGGCL